MLTHPLTDGTGPMWWIIMAGASLGQVGKLPLLIAASSLTITDYRANSLRYCVESVCG